MITRTTIRDDVIRRYCYPVAQSTSYILEGDASDWVEYKDEYVQKNMLSGTIKLHLEPINKRQTEYVVAVRYVLVTKQSHTVVKVPVNNPLGRDNMAWKQTTSSKVFWTNKPLLKTIQDGMNVIDICCGSTGKLERDFLELL